MLVCCEVLVNNLPSQKAKKKPCPVSQPLWSSSWLEQGASVAVTQLPSVCTSMNGGLGELREAGVLGVIHFVWYLK